MIQRDELLRWSHSSTGLCFESIHPTDDTLIEFRVLTHGVVHTRALLHQSGKNVVEVADGKCIAGTIITNHAFRTRASSVPRLAQRISLAHEQHVVALHTTR